MSDFDILVDSDGFVALFVEHDAHHETAKSIFQHAADAHKRLTASNFIIAESATVISRLSGQENARKFLSFANTGNFPILPIDYTLERKTFNLFSDQENKRTSVFDCSNVILMQEFGIPFIFSFDHFYKRFDLNTADQLIQ